MPKSENIGARIKVDNFGRQYFGQTITVANDYYNKDERFDKMFVVFLPIIEANTLHFVVDSDDVVETFTCTTVKPEYIYVVSGVSQDEKTVTVTDIVKGNHSYDILNKEDYAKLNRDARYGWDFFMEYFNDYNTVLSGPSPKLPRRKAPPLPIYNKDRLY